MPAAGRLRFTAGVQRDRLPYHLNVRFELVRLDRPQEFEVSVAGDLTSTGIWTLTPAATASMSARLARRRRPPAAPLPDARPATALSLEPQLGDQARHEGLEPYARSRAGG